MNGAQGNKDELWLNHGKSIGATTIEKKAHIRMKQHRIMQKSSLKL